MGEFRDPGTVLMEFADEVLVVCPACGALARVLGPAGELFGRRRLVCGGCGHSASWDPGSVAIGDALDPWFRLPLWLQASVRGHTLWSWNARHLDLLDDVVSARVRRRPADGRTRTLVASLPGWMKDRHNEAAIRSAIADLRERLP